MARPNLSSSGWARVTPEPGYYDSPWSPLVVFSAVRISDFGIMYSVLWIMHSCLQCLQSRLARWIILTPCNRGKRAVKSCNYRGTRGGRGALNAVLLVSGDDGENMTGDKDDYCQSGLESRSWLGHSQQWAGGLRREGREQVLWRWYLGKLWK